MPNRKYTTVSIPLPLHNKIKELIGDTGFSSVSDFATYVLRQVVIEENEAKKSRRSRDEEKIKSRLRSLGYIS